MTYSTAPVPDLLGELTVPLKANSVCTQPGTPGSSPACSTCVASCSDDPADPISDAELDYWLHLGPEGGHAGRRAMATWEPR